VLGATIRMGLSVLTIPLFIRLIGVEEYGLWTLASSTVRIVSLAEVGLSVSTTVFLSRDLANDDTDSLSQTLTVTVGTMLLLATTAAITLWISAPKLVELFGSLEQTQYIKVVQALRIGGVVIWAQLLQKVIVGVEQAYQKYGVINVLSTLQLALINLGLLLVAWFGGKTAELMHWQAVISVGMLVAHCWAGWILLGQSKVHIAWEFARGLAIVQYSLMTWLTSIGSVIFGQVDRLIVGALLGTEKLGIYAAITTITRQINTFSALPVQPILPTLSGEIEKKEVNHKNIKKKVIKALQVNGIIAYGLGAIFLAFAPFIMEVMIPDVKGNNYIREFNIAVIIYALYSTNAVGYYILLSVKAVKSCMLIVLASGILSLLLISGGGWHLGLIGAILGNAGYIFSFSLTLFALNKIDVAIIEYANYIKYPMAFFVLVFAVSILNSF
ncbi:MAG: oligosaccharide flippase family protein, partial [Ekhidna sp.]